MKKIEFETVDFSTDGKNLKIIDQTKLPNKLEIIELNKKESIWEAIYKLRVRGAPAIGVAAAIGLTVAMKDEFEEDLNKFKEKFKEVKDYLASSRPTAVNLFWALNRMEKILESYEGNSSLELLDELEKEARKIRQEDIEICKKIGEYGRELIEDGYGILTHCNAGALATVKYGTATAPIYLAHQDELKIKVYADETRPLLQGARLTSYELMANGIDTTLICDNMSQSIMRFGLVNIVFVGCDRVAINGDTANKIGTSMLALAAKRHNIPFYVCCPTSTIDFDIESGEDIEIEMRTDKEVTEMWYEKRMAPEDVKVINPSFDVTDWDLITGIITEEGIIYPPFKENLLKLKEKLGR